MKRSPKSGLDISLRCLQHPLTWLSIATLLLNDHLFKVVAPSWLTGKLSDFAGLFFFPFLLAAGLSLFLDPLHCPARRIGRIAFGLTGAWFALIKTIPWANTLTTNFVFCLLGFSPQIVLDFTDLFALSAFWPAWRLWNRPVQARPGRTAWIALTIGALASLATPPLVPVPYIRRLANVNGVLYAADLAHSDRYFVARSKDGGRTWQSIYNEEQPQGIFRDVTLPLEVCNPSESQECYRISGQEEIQISTDGGLSWEIAWGVPHGRRDFMQRFASWRYHREEEQVDLGPYDMIFFEQNDDTYLLVAMGNEGVMRRRTPDGDWERYEVGMARPTPYMETNLEEMVFIMQGEVDLWISIASFTLLGACIVSWQVLSKQIKTSEERHYSSWWSLWPVSIPTFLVGTLSGIAIVLSWKFGISLILLIQEPFLCGLVLLMLMVGFVFTWRRITGAILEPKIAHTTAIWCLLISMGVLVVGTIPWLLWARGIIALYETARVLALSLTVLVLVCGFYQIRQIGRRTQSL